MDFDFDLVLWLIQQVIFHDPTKHYHIKGSRQDWLGLPKTKSLFYALPGRGLPIGNLTSQLFGNVYLNDFDHFVKFKLGCRYYGRYVDDFVIVHEDKDFLKSLIPRIRTFLLQDTGLELHPHKIYLQHYTKGVLFLGTIIKPYRSYIRNRTKGNFYQKIDFWHDRFLASGRAFTEEERVKFISSLNSYFGILRHCHTGKLRRKIGCLIRRFFGEYVLVSDTYRKVTLGLASLPNPPASASNPENFFSRTPGSGF